MKLYVTGGREKKALFKKAEEWVLYERALILSVDTDKGTSEVCVDYITPREARSTEKASITFKAGTLRDNRFYVCTSTEAMVYRVPDFHMENYISLPCFNDLHHVYPTPEGNLLVVSTGLDMVVEVSLNGKVLREWNVLGQDPWERFSRGIDYRKVLTTKPHMSHPNFAFRMGEQVWVTRFEQRDAICLTEPGLQINIGLQRVHDGFVYNDRIYFTTVDGNLIVVDRESLRISQVIDLSGEGGNKVLGWCRGVFPVDERHAWVGFSRVRKTQFVQHIAWVKPGFREIEKPTHIALYDIVAGRRLQEIELESGGLNMVFGMYPVEPIRQPCRADSR